MFQCVFKEGNPYYIAHISGETSSDSTIGKDMIVINTWNFAEATRRAWEVRKVEERLT